MVLPETPVSARRSVTKLPMRSPSSSRLRAIGVPARLCRDSCAGRPDDAYVDAGTEDDHRIFRRMADVTVCTSCRRRVTGERSMLMAGTCWSVVSEERDGVAGGRSPVSIRTED